MGWWLWWLILGVGFVDRWLWWWWLIFGCGSGLWLWWWVVVASGDWLWFHLGFFFFFSLRWVRVATLVFVCGDGGGYGYDWWWWVMVLFWFFSSSLFFLYYGLWLPWWLWLVEWWGRWLSIGFCGGFLILFSWVVYIILDEVVKVYRSFNIGCIVKWVVKIYKIDFWVVKNYIFFRSFDVNALKDVNSDSYG